MFAASAMEVLFVLLYARNGKKATDFCVVSYRALGVEFDFSRSEQRLLSIYNAAQKKQDFLKISEVLVLFDWCWFPKSGKLFWWVRCVVWR